MNGSHIKTGGRGNSVTHGYRHDRVRYPDAFLKRSPVNDHERFIKSLNGLIERYGEVSVEDTLIYIAQAKDSDGRSVNILFTREMVEQILKAIHGK